MALLRPLPEPFASAYARADEGNRGLRRAIEALADASPYTYFVRRARWNANRTGVDAVEALYASELAPGEKSLPAYDRYPEHRTWGHLGDVMRESCESCDSSAYVVCEEYMDNRFDPDWHADLYVLCLDCREYKVWISDSYGSYSRASSERI